MLLILCSGITQAQPQLQSDTETATAGYFQLSWQDDSSSQYVLQQATTPEFSDAHSIYQGYDRASVISGLANGHYYYRVRGISERDWSNPVAVVVEHHPLSRAFAFFGLGAVMFVATLFVLINGVRRQHNT